MLTNILYANLNDAREIQFQTLAMIFGHIFRDTLNAF